MNFKPEDIDPLLLEIITILNNKGFHTMGCCQGRRSQREFKEKKHMPEAYIAFFNKLPQHMEDIARNITPLYVYGDDNFGTSMTGIASIRITTEPTPNAVVGYKLVKKHCIETWTDDNIQKVIEANKAFIENISKIFNL